MQRRTFLACAASASALLTDPGRSLGMAAPSAERPAALDLHVHLDKSTIDQVAALGKQQGVRYGIVEHCGTKENIYPVVLSNDIELRDYLAMLDGKGVYRGVQTEWTDWMSGFSTAALAQLDYILTDAMTFPGRDGKRVKLWEKDAPDRVDMSKPQAFMDRYVDWYVQIIEQQPIDILANVSWLPAPLAGDYDGMWTTQRIERVAGAALKFGVALEISSGYKLPTRRFLEVAKRVGVKFSFGTNGRYPNMGKLEHSLAMAADLGLTQADMFTPGLPTQKAIVRRVA